MSSHAVSTAFSTDHIGVLIAPRESAYVAHPHELERGFFAPKGGCVVLSLPYHAPSFH